MNVKVIITLLPTDIPLITLIIFFLGIELLIAQNNSKELKIFNYILTDVNLFY